MNFPIDDLHLFTLNVGLAYHDGDWNFKNVRSPFARLYLVVEGTARIQLPSGVYDLKPGYLYMKSTNEDVISWTSGIILSK